MRRLFPFFVIALLLATSAHAANIVIINNDAAGEGFNDPTPASPVGGNPGTTIGQQRLNVFQHAADLWGAILPSNITIRVLSNFDPLSCDANSAVLGSAGPMTVFRDFTNAEFPGTWYHSALADKQANQDLDPPGNDISATFNSSVDNNNNCLNGTNWYYGFDGNEGGDVELLTVVLHELAHGLGFAEFVDHSTGQLFNGLPDVYSRFLYDETVQKTWPQMTNAQRASSAVNTGNLVWNGFAANFAAQSFLEAPPVVVISAPAAIAGTLTQVGTASFGPSVNSSPVSGEVVLVDDGTGTTSDGCEPLINGGVVAGRIALIDRGSCTFASKVLNAQNAGAIGVLIANNTTGVINMAGSDPSITIPTLMITQADGNNIKSQLNLGQTVLVSMQGDPGSLAGTSAGTGQLLVYTPNPLQPGSSISHWDVSASPNLLMEPAINSDLHDNVDLTRYHFEDIGWFDQRVTATPDIPAARTALLGNHPNPFNPKTTIRFQLARSGEVRLDIFDASGRLVRHLTRETMDAGPHAVQWDGRSDEGETVASGVYHYRLQAGNDVVSDRMVLLK